MHRHLTEKVVIVGSGIIGLAHALVSREAGCEVTVIERDTRPLGASIRNFGTIWPIGLAFGPEREQALFGVQRWRELAKTAGFWMETAGSLSVAYRDEAWAVLQEFGALPAAKSENFELLLPEETLRRYPLVNPEGLQGALFSPHELTVRSADALTALIAHLRGLGVEFHYGACATKVHADAVELADGRMLAFDHCVIAAGDEMRLLFPEELAAAQVRRCQLQMMRSEPIPQRLGAILVSDLTLAHYPAFQGCRSLAKLQSRIEATMGEFKKWGIHVIAAQHGDGSVTLGDSHEYADDFLPDHWSHVDELVLKNLASFMRLPNLRVASRWQGVYLKSTVGKTQVILQPQERVTMVTAMGGLGMTLSWGLAHQTVSAWSNRSAAT